MYTKRFYYPDFNPAWSLDNQIETQVLLQKCFYEKYDELDNEGKADVHTTLNKILQFINQGHDGKEIVRRIALTTALAIEENILNYYPCSGKMKILKDAFLSGATLPQDIKFLAVGESGSQACDEASFAFNHLVDCLSSTKEINGLTEALDACVTGYAIGPISDEDLPRDVFNWLLCEVIPAAVTKNEPAMIFSLSTPWPSP